MSRTAAPKANGGALLRGGLSIRRTAAPKANGGALLRGALPIRRTAAPKANGGAPVFIARACAWCLYLGAWIGFGNLLQALASGPLVACAWLAGWLAASGAFGLVLDRLSMSRAAARALLMLASTMGAAGVLAALHGGGSAAIGVAIFGFALLIAQARRVARAAMDAMPQAVTGDDRGPDWAGAGAPIPAALAGAALAWLAAGDPGDLRASSVSWLLGALAVSALLALRLPSRIGGPSPDWRASSGLPECAWLGGAAGGGIVRLASLAMAPMMCGLPLMVGLCSALGMSARVALGLHLAAMFLPALALALARTRPGSGSASASCALLLVAAAALALRAPDAFAGLGVAWLLAAAWSLAWGFSLRLDESDGARADLRYEAGEAASCAACPPLANALVGALLVLAFGWSLSTLGLAAVEAWPMALGGLAGLLELARLAARRSLLMHRVCRIGVRTGAGAAPRMRARPFIQGGGKAL